MDRREFLKRGGAIGAAIAIGGAVGAAGEQQKAASMPTIRLGDLEVSRLLLGTNPFFGWAHKEGDVSRLMKEWYTDERIMETLDAAAAQGGTAVVGPPYERWQAL